MSSTKHNSSVYLLDSIDQESNRLCEQHDIYKSAMGDKLVLAPIDLNKGGLRVLDSATANGYWLYDLTRDLSLSPSAATNVYIGTDISSKRFPSPPPPNVTFSLQDITEPWPVEWKDSFDLVHQRLALAGCRDYPVRDAVQALIGNVKPGGWVQLVEHDQDVGPDDGPWMNCMATVVWQVLKATKLPEPYADKLKTILEEAGMEEVHEEKLEMLLGAASPDPELAAKGVRDMIILADFLVGIVRTLPAEVNHGLTEEELSGLTPGLKEELTEKGGHYPFRVVWARKPAE